MINESTGNNLHNLTQKDCIIAATMIIIDIPTKMNSVTQLETRGSPEHVSNGTIALNSLILFTIDGEKKEKRQIRKYCFAFTESVSLNQL